MFNEDTRVKIPAILHLCRLGYKYLSLKGAKIDQETNIFTDIFKESICEINQDLDPSDVGRLLDDIKLLLDNEDLGKAFYERLVERSGIKLIDFENFDANQFHVVTELTYQKDDDNFRPDIILLINGMPLVFIEVKKPNNKDGVIAERNRIITRFRNKKFRKFVNITQFMIFSNNMEYDDESTMPIQGAFYASPSYQRPVFNYFREEEQLDLNAILRPEDEEIENYVLKDNNLVGIKNSEAFLTNKNPLSPTHRICTSMLNRERLAFILDYALAYVYESSGMEKHIMRYPQIFATKAIERKLDEGIRKGIIWHTQGSGKTALAFYSVKFLTDYFNKYGIIAKFYFIVDRLDLLTQASREFKSRGLVVQHVSSKEEFARTIKSPKAIENDAGKAEITVVNIQRFKDDPDVARNTDYNLSLQRVYFLDEVHRSYNPKGSFLANLRESDPNSIKIGLTGTPLLGNDYNSRQLFGGYIHKYYYNASIADGYTLRLIREEIETSYQLKLKKTLEEIEILKGDADRKIVFAHPRFVEPMLDYIITDFENSRITMNDESIGAMVICDSSDQAKEMFNIFNAKYADRQAATNQTFPLIEQSAPAYGSYNQKRKERKKVNSAALILYDVGSIQEKKDWIANFKDGKIDILFVYRMLLTGFDAKRLKKLYLGRIIRAHNLLQALTRVNRTYKSFKYGYVVDFADIQSEFKKTNEAYFKELQEELGDELENYSNLFMTPEEIESKIDEIKEALFLFDTQNAELFSQQINQINDRRHMQQITRALNDAKSIYNVIRTLGQFDLLEKLDFKKLKSLSIEANNRLALINARAMLENHEETSNLLNLALEDVYFAFAKVGEEEMILADKLRTTMRNSRKSLAGNFDQQDPAFVSLKEELERLFKKKNLNEVSREEMTKNMEALKSIQGRAKELERKNQLIKAKYDNDAKYARIHKRLREKGELTTSEMKLFEALSALKQAVDHSILQNSRMLENESFVEKMMLRIVIEKLKKQHQLPLDAIQSKFINKLVVQEYMHEYYGRTA
jgi:type I restriction enzyme R subunit